MNLTKKYRIFITSNEPWGDIWFSKQHYANELAKLGHEVFFLNAPLGWSIKNLFSKEVTIEKIQSNLSVINYANPFPIRGLKGFMLWLNDRINEKKIYKAVVASKLPILWWKFDPFRFVYLRSSWAGQPILDLYHVTDPFDGIFSDKLLAQQSKLVVTVLQRYQNYYEGLNQKSVLYIPHGISSDEFVIDPVVQKNYVHLKGAIVKIGTINDYYNIQLLIEIAKTFKDRILVLVGPNKLTLVEKQQQFNELEKLPNVVVEGAQKATVLKYYVDQAAVCIVPYDFNIESLKGTPLKVLNYLAQEKISITSIATDLEHLLDKGLVKSADATHFIQGIQDVLDGKLNFTHKIRFK